MSDYYPQNTPTKMVKVSKSSGEANEVAVLEGEEWMDVVII